MSHSVKISTLFVFLKYLFSKKFAIVYIRIYVNGTVFLVF